MNNINKNTIIVLVIIVITILYFFFGNSSKKEAFTDPSGTVITLNSVTSMDDKVAINTLAQISRSLMSGGGLTIPGTVKITGNVTIDGAFNYLPTGVIVAWKPPGGGSAAPAGWAICDGSGGTPDLRGRFILGVGNSNTEFSIDHPMDQKDGKEKHKLTVAEIPSHNHNDAVNKSILSWNVALPGQLTAYAGGGGGSYVNSNSLINSTGGGNEHNNMPPYYVLQYIMKL